MNDLTLVTMFVAKPRGCDLVENVTTLDSTKVSEAISLLYVFCSVKKPSLAFGIHMLSEQGVASCLELNALAIEPRPPETVTN